MYEEHADRGHWLLGYPTTVQGPMELSCELVTNGYAWSLATETGQEAATRLKPQARRWRLLLQVDSDNAAGIELGDDGRLYYWIRDDDLAARRFDRVWCIEQQH